MSVKAELEGCGRQVFRVEPLNLLPPDASFFQRTLVRTVTDIFDYEIEDLLAVDAASREVASRFLPLVDFLVKSRSIGEHQELKRGLLDLIWEYDKGIRIDQDKPPPTTEEERRISDVVTWLKYILPEIKFISGTEMDNLVDFRKTPDEVWNMFEIQQSREPREVSDKIISYERAVELARQCHLKFDGFVGYVGGKWRLGLHDEHKSLIRAAKESLGAYGLMLVGVETQESIWLRRGANHFSYDDQTRLTHVANQESVDYTFPIGPNSGDLGEQNEYYERVWENLAIDRYFFGSADYHWRPEFERRADRSGVIVLWERPTTSFSSSEILRQIINAS